MARGSPMPRGSRKRPAATQPVATLQRRKIATPSRASGAAAKRELDLKQRRQSLRFSKQPEECTICCSDVSCGEAVRLACSHGWYCRSCLERYAQARLAEGALDVACPDCREPIPDHDLKKIFPNQDVINRFHERSITRAVASSSNLHPCPTAGCNMCFEIEDGDYWLRHCPQCKKGGCLACGVSPYHHGASCEEHAAKLARAKQGNKAPDAALMRWMRRTGTKQCPQCKMGVSKEDLASQGTQRKECHKMMCRHCDTKFCFKCLAILTDTYNCGCSIERHGFFNPKTLRRNEHLKQKVARPVGPRRIATPVGRRSHAGGA